jgi:hypothetical protein
MPSKVEVAKVREYETQRKGKGKKEKEQAEKKA